MSVAGSPDPGKPPLSLLPTEARLLRGLRTALLELGEIASLDAAARFKLRAADGILNELLLRRDGARQVDYYRRCRALVDRGDAMLRDAATVGADPLPAEPDSNWTYDRASIPIHAAFARLGGLVCRAARLGTGDADVFVRDVLDVELDMHRRRQDPAMSTAELALPRRASIDRATVEAYLAQRFPDRVLVVEELTELVGGFQKTTLLVTVRDDAGHRENMVFRIEKDGEKYVNLDAGTVTVEYDIVRFVHGGGVPSAEPLFLETDPTWLGGAFMVTSKVPGRTVAVTGLEPKAGGDGLSAAAARSIVETLGAIHALPVQPLAYTAIGHGLRHRTLAENTAAIIESWDHQRWSRHMAESPSTHYVFDWLRANIPADDEPPVLVHMDYGVHNILVDHDAVSAVLDWESARIGDPAEDLAYLFQSLGPGVDRRALRECYEAASGRRIPEYRLRYWDVYNALKVMLASAHAAALYEDDPLAGIEWSSLALNIYVQGASGLQEKIAAAEAARAA